MAESGGSIERPLGVKAKSSSRRLTGLWKLAADAMVDVLGAVTNTVATAAVVVMA